MSDTHIQSCEAEVAGARAQEGSIVHQLQQIGDQEKLKKRMAIKAFIRCAQFLAHRRIPHTTNFDKLVDLIISCGVEDLKRFLEKAGKNCNLHIQNSCC